MPLAAQPNGTMEEHGVFLGKGKQFRFSALSRDQKVILVSVSTGNLLSYLSLSILAPFFPIEADKKGVNGTIAGWIFGVLAMVKFASSPLFARLIPHAGTKFVLLSGLFLCGGCTICFGLLDGIETSRGNVCFIAMCFVTRSILGVGCTAIANAGFVYLVKGFPDNVGSAFGIVEIFTGVGMVAGPALGGFLYDTGGFFLPFAVIGIACLLMVPVVWLTLTSQTDSNDDDESVDSPMWKAIFHPKSLVNSILVALGAASWSVLDPTLEPHLRVYGLKPSIVGLFFLAMALSYSIASPIWGRLADKMPDKRYVVLPGLLMTAVGFLISGPSPALGFDIEYNELWLSVFAVIVLGFATNMFLIPTFGIYVDMLGEIGYPENTRTYGTMSSLWVSMYSLGDFAGPSLGGFLNQEVGFEWLTTWFGAACIFTSLIVAVSWYIEVKCRRNRVSEIGEKTVLLPTTKGNVFDFE